MTIIRCCLTALSAIAINAGFPAVSLTAQQFPPGHNHTDSCDGSCRHGGERDSYGPNSYQRSPQSTMQRNDQAPGYQSQSAPPSYRRDNTMQTPLDYSQDYQDRQRYQSQFQDDSSEPYGYTRREGSEMPRENYELRRGGSTYTNDPSRFQSDNTPIGVHPNRSGGSYRRHGRRGHESRTYGGNGQPPMEPGQQYGNEADRAPQLNSYTPNPDMRSSGQTGSRRPQQEFGNPVSRPGVGMTNDESFTIRGPPLTGCGHAGCNHNHN